MAGQDGNLGGQGGVEMFRVPSVFYAQPSADLDTVQLLRCTNSHEDQRGTQYVHTHPLHGGPHLEVLQWSMRALGRLILSRAEVMDGCGAALPGPLQPAEAGQELVKSLSDSVIACPY